jgi:hypothetical protein
MHFEHKHHVIGLNEGDWLRESIEAYPFLWVGAWMPVWLVLSWLGWVK